MKETLFSPFLSGAGTVLLDGALATELEHRGADLNDPLWSAKVLLERPDLIREVHYDYFLAGADVATTATYQASFAGFARRGIHSDEAAALMRLAVHLACEARDRFWADAANRVERVRPLVAASVGPYGAYLADGSEYSGDYGLSVSDLADFHRARVAVLVDSDADLLAFETIPSLDEARALVGLLAEFPRALAWLSFSCADEATVCHGEPFADCAALAEESAQIVAVGVNCTDPAYVAALLAKGRAVTTKPLLAYPNSGEGWDATARRWLPRQSPLSFADAAITWRAAGASLIGGCCRTTPATVAAIAGALSRAHTEMHPI